MAPYHVEEDIIEDSEPEREATRRAPKPKSAYQSPSESTSRFTKHTSTQKRDNARMAPMSIIEISDDSLTVPQSQKPQGEQCRGHESISIIDITSSSISSPLSILKPVKTTNKPTDLHSSSVNQKDAEEDDLLSDDELPSLGLARFSFNFHSRSKQVSRPFSTSVSVTNSIPSIPNPTNDSKSISKRKASRNGPRFSDDFSDEELARLLRCVACDIRWTVRKTASQKVAHIQSCSKKKGFTEDTVRQLIRKELVVTPLNPSDKGKRKASPDSEAQPKTILAEIVQDAAPKKRTKRQDVVMTIKSLGETRAAILDKAQTVFAQSSSTFRALHSSEYISHTEGSSGIPPPSTPEFGSSHLARTTGSKQPMFHSFTTPENHHNLVFPILSPILDPTSTAPPHVLATSDVSNKATVITTPKKSTLTVTPLVYLSSSSSGTTPNSPKLPRDYQSSRSFSPVHAEEPEVDCPQQDDVYLHYLPPPVSASSKPALLWGDQDGLSVSCDTPATTVAPNILDLRSKSNTSPSKRKRKPTSRRGVEYQFDDDWEQQIRDNILADNELHMRILRYEPIPFQTFLEHSPINDVKSNGKLKAALKQFLDKQAIHFYDEETMGRRR
ncbi:hypothetical protein L218DRAFT_1073469 [Marasmius fiardii PR-910]|nr:hypothetical protein L218DRAFT_1073469 [Marasmius fiardii PR-910]